MLSNVHKKRTFSRTPSEQKEQNNQMQSPAVVCLFVGMALLILSKARPSGHGMMMHTFFSAHLSPLVLYEKRYLLNISPNKYSGDCPMTNSACVQCKTQKQQCISQVPGATLSSNGIRFSRTCFA